MKKIYLLGFGSGDKGEVTLKTLETLKKCGKVFVRTSKHPSCPILDEYGIKYETFDALYDSAESFEEVYDAIALSVTRSEAEYTAYIVPGSAVMAEKSVFNILARADCDVEIIPSVSFLDSIFASLKTDAAASFKLLDALRLDTQKPDVRCLNIICQVYDREIASDVKLALSKYYSDDIDVFLVNAAGTKEEKIIRLKLYETDRCNEINHLTTLVIPPQGYAETLSSFESLKEIIETLRGDNGCPWDKEQTHESLTPYVVEEAYEVVDAINKSDPDALCEELGDLMLQIVLHAQIAHENGTFDISDVVEGVSRKMLRRHPHVFGNVNLPEDFCKFWDDIKKSEHDYSSVSEEMENVPKNFPALVYAGKIQKKASNAGFDFGSNEAVIADISDSLKKLICPQGHADKEDTADEIGEILFLLCRIAEKTNVNAEEALKKTCVKFSERFSTLEKQSMAQRLKNDDIDQTNIKKI